MATLPILMPKLGLTMTEGVLAEWKVGAGDTVASGDVLFVVETDKISNEVEAQAAGTIGALLAAEGETLPVGAVLANWADDAVPATEQPHTPAPPENSAAPPSLVMPARIAATPLARRLARNAGLDLAEVSGSGPRGRITAQDVMLARRADGSRGLGQRGADWGLESALEIAEAGTALSVSSAATTSQLPPASLPSSAQSEPVEDRAPTAIPLTSYQRTTARRLTEAKRDIPHFYVQSEADVTDLLHLREQLNADADQPKLTVSHFLVTALARVLAAMPTINRVWADDHLRGFGTIDIGMAVETPKGLVAPVMRDLGALSLDEVASTADVLVTRARAGRLAPEDLAGGAVAVSNVGMFGAKALVPIVNPGQSSILGVGAAVPTFRPDAGGAPVLRQVLTLTLSCDHRVIDGALAARFLQALVSRLESPAGLLRRPPPREPFT